MYVYMQATEFVELGSSAEPKWLRNHEMPNMIATAFVYFIHNGRGGEGIFFFILRIDRSARAEGKQYGSSS